MAERRIGYVALVVRDYDEAIAYYTSVLDFVLIEDTPLTDSKRWVLVAPSPASETRLLLARAAGAEQESRIGAQTGGRVFLFLHTDDFWRDYETFLGRGVRFVRPPTRESYGTVAVFKDLYGNLWDLLELVEDQRVDIHRVHADRAVGAADALDQCGQLVAGLHRGNGSRRGRRGRSGGHRRGASIVEGDQPAALADRASRRRANR